MLIPRPAQNTVHRVAHFMEEILRCVNVNRTEFWFFFKSNKNLPLPPAFLRLVAKRKRHHDNRGLPFLVIQLKQTNLITKKNNKK